VSFWSAQVWRRFVTVSLVMRGTYDRDV